MNATVIDMMNRKELEVEFYPQGILAEKIRAGGAGLLGILTDIGIDTILVENKEMTTIDGHSISKDLTALRTLNDSHRALTGNEAAEYIATCTTDLRAFIHFGRGQATCYGPIAENIHAANERVNIDSVMHVARAYANFFSTLVRVDRISLIQESRFSANHNMLWLTTIP